MKLTMRLGPRSYDIIIKKGVLGRVGLLTNLTGKVLLVTDTGTPAKYIKKVAAQCGEAHLLALDPARKDLFAVGAVLAALHQNRFGKNDLVAAVGGGFVGDVAGFAAGCYLQGVPFCQLPTTTTSQLCSAVGGRAGVDLDGGLGNVGLWHQPALVAVDPAVLATLPERVFASGMAQALKTGLVASRELFELLERTDDPHRDIEHIIYLSLRAKKGLVEQDEAATGQRRLLSFGYTVGQAAEAACEGALLHGECVGLGMLPMIESRTLLRRTRAVMKKLCLPLKNPVPREKMLAWLHAQPAGGARVVARVKAAGQGYLETMADEELELLINDQ